MAEQLSDSSFFKMEFTRFKKDLFALATKLAVLSWSPILYDLTHHENASGAKFLQD